MITRWKRALANTTVGQARDTGMAVVLVCLILAVARRQAGYVVAAAAFHVVNMVIPRVYRAAAVLWFGFSHLLGTVVSRIVLALAFFLVVTPIGLLRRAFGADTLQLKPFKAGRGSVMHERNYTFTGKDFERPY